MITIEAPIEAVTVYTDRTLVTRRGRVTLEAGEQQVILTHLPLRLVPASVRAAGRGTVPARILSVDVAKTFHAEPPNVAVAQLEAQIKPLEEEDQALVDSGTPHPVARPGQHLPRPQVRGQRPHQDHRPP
jgi:hypothetical protein